MKKVRRVVEVITDRPNESIYDVIQEYYVGCVYPDNDDSFYVCSNIPSEYYAYYIRCKDGGFYAFFTEEELINGGIPGTVIKYYLKKSNII